MSSSTLTKTQKRGRNNIQNTTRNIKRTHTKYQPKEKSVYLFINLHGTIRATSTPHSTKNFEDVFVKVNIPEEIKHITKITRGVFGCSIWGSSESAYEYLLKLKKYTNNLNKRNKKISFNNYGNSRNNSLNYTRSTLLKNNEKLLSTYSIIIEKSEELYKLELQKTNIDDEIY